MPVPVREGEGRVQEEARTDSIPEQVVDFGADAVVHIAAVDMAADTQHEQTLA